MGINLIYFPSTKRNSHTMPFISSLPYYSGYYADRPWYSRYWGAYGYYGRAAIPVTTSHVEHVPRTELRERVDMVDRVIPETRAVTVPRVENIERKYTVPVTHMEEEVITVPKVV